MSTIKIHVTKTDIQEAKQGDPYACMVWRAVTRNLQLESGTGAAPVQTSVDYDDITFDGMGGTIRVKLPDGIGNKISDWDNDKSKVNPFDFDINLPDDWRQQITNPKGHTRLELNADGTPYDDPYGDDDEDE